MLRSYDNTNNTGRALYAYKSYYDVYCRCGSENFEMVLYQNKFGYRDGQKPLLNKRDIPTNCIYIGKCSQILYFDFLMSYFRGPMIGLRYGYTEKQLNDIKKTCFDICNITYTARPDEDEIKIFFQNATGLLKAVNVIANNYDMSIHEVNFAQKIKANIFKDKVSKSLYTSFIKRGFHRRGNARNLPEVEVPSVIKNILSS